MGYDIQDILSWYQKKIGTYDKQQWEKTVEQRILSGLTHIPMKTAKLKTEFIDVDLVRGSTFTKAKPKLGFFKVTRLAVLRLGLFPYYLKWWCMQTTHRMTALLLGLYLLQVIGTALFFAQIYGIYYVPDILETVSTSDVLVPFVMMLILSIIHSHILSTNSAMLGVTQPETRSSKQKKKSKRVKRRTAKSSRVRSHNTQSSEFDSTSIDVTLESGSFSESNCNRTSRPKSGNKSDSPKSRRSVAWDASVSGSHNRTGESHAKEVPFSSVDSGNQTTSVDTTLSETCVKKEQPSKRKTHSPSQEDDGFESLDSLDSADSCKKALDVQVSTAECKTLVRERDSSTESRCFIPKMDKSVGKSDPDSENDSGDELTAEYSLKSKKIVRRRLTRESSNEDAVESSVNSSGDESENEGAMLDEMSAIDSGMTGVGEWTGITTNSEEYSYSSQLEDGSDDDPLEQQHSTLTSDNNDHCHPFAFELNMIPTDMLSPSCVASGKVSCTIWEKKEVKKANLSVLDISSAIIARVESMPENIDYFLIGLLMSVISALVPAMCRIYESIQEMKSKNITFREMAHAGLPVCHLHWTDSFLAHTLAIPSVLLSAVSNLFKTAYGSTPLEQSLGAIATIERFFLSALFFFLLTVAERTFKQRFLYAKFFSHLTSFRRARKSELPHFRLNKVRNIKTWLSVRSYLKKRGPQRSVDVIVSSALLICSTLVSYVSLTLFRDGEYNVEVLVWCGFTGFFIIRFMTLGFKINRKYRNLSTIITEQINLYLQIERKPSKKDELMVANSVLKLAADLLKELEKNPSKISCFSTNAYWYIIARIFILSALSGILSEICGFKLKLHKIKIK